VVRRVLEAGLAELARSGYAGFRMDEVAARAGVNRTTIYRRWPNRRALVTAVVDRLRASLRDSPLPDTGTLERDLVEAFARRWTYGRRAEGRAWARLLEQRHDPEVAKIVGPAVDARRTEWRHMVTRAIGRRELPAGTDEQRLLDYVHAIADARRARALDVEWLRAAVRTVVAGARAGTLVRGPATRRART
jgi:AcrR family transcriptional regulator